MATTPYEIIAGPAYVWAGAYGASYPAINAVPDSAVWTDLGLTEGGVTARHSQSVELIRADQRSGPVKAIRSEEMMEIETALAQMDLERWAVALNNIVVSKWVYFNSAGANNALKWHSALSGAYFRIRTLGGVSQSFDVTKTGAGTAASPYDITIQLATNGGGTVTTTASTLVSSFNADSDVNTIVTAALDTVAEANTGAGLVDIFAFTASTERSLKTRQGLDVNRLSLLVRGPSPYGNWNLQYEVPFAVQVEEP